MGEEMTEEMTEEQFMEAIKEAADAHRAAGHAVGIERIDRDKLGLYVEKRTADGKRVGPDGLVFGIPLTTLHARQADDYLRGAMVTMKAYPRLAAGVVYAKTVVR